MKIDKDAIKNRMLALEHAELDHALEAHDSFRQDSHLSDRETHDRDDEAMARMNADLAHSFDHPVHEHKAKITLISKTDFGPKTTAERGAVVRFGGNHYVIVTSTQRFRVGEIELMGISLDSPAFRAMKGLGAGDIFSLNGREFTLDHVW